jgi:hypothetical protein
MLLWRGRPRLRVQAAPRREMLRELAFMTAAPPAACSHAPMSNRSLVATVHQDAFNRLIRG